MSWILSQRFCENWHSLPGREEESLPANCSDGEQFAQLNVMPTPHKFWRNDKTMEFSRLSQFGLTCKLLTENHGEELLTLYRAGFHARTFHAQEVGKGLPGNEVDFGRSSQGLLARYDPSTHSLKTAQCSLFEDLMSLSVTLPRSGILQNGSVYQLKSAPRRISATESGLWPTPKANDAEKRGNFDLMNPRNGLPAAAKLFPTPCTIDSGSRVNRSKSKEAAIRPTLGAMAKFNVWPTPRAMDCKGAPKNRFAGSETYRSNLSEAVRDNLESGQLNPQFVEWLMGWPSGWTDLKPLEMDKFQEWLQQHSKT
jgi:hypothetical protein